MVDQIEQKLRSIIVEDNEGALLELKSKLKFFDNVIIEGEAKLGKAAVNLIRRKEPDLIFMDIELPDMDGFEVLKNIEYKPMVIFTTAYDKYGVEAFKSNGIDFILKPIDDNDLKQAILKAITHKNRLNSKILEVIDYILKKKNQINFFSVKISTRQGDKEILVVPKDEVFYFKAEDKYVFLYTNEKRYFYDATLSQLEKKLDPDIFLKIHRKYIVSISKIEKLKRRIYNPRDYIAVLRDTNSTRIDVGREFFKNLKSKLAF